MSERCGCWIQVAGEDFVCMRPIDHEGECEPDEVEVIERAQALEETAIGLHAWISDRE